MVETITSMDGDFARWYVDVAEEAELYDCTNVKGCMMIKPADYAVWENIQREMDRRLKETEAQDIYMSIFTPESLSEEGENHVEEFTPEAAWVTRGGLEELQERICIRLISEALSYDFYVKDIHLYRNLPRVYNQWCSAACWGKTTRSFLRSGEFLWQEGHTAHTSAEEAEARTIQMLGLYADFREEVLATPVIRDQKTGKEEFAGTKATYTIESLMRDGKTLQSGTSHNFSDGFAEAFDIQFMDEDNILEYVYQTSWGVSTRVIGTIIMVHGDNSGLVPPPRTAPIQIVMISVQQQKEGVLDEAYELKERLTKAGLVVKVDDTDKSPGWKFANCKMYDVSLRMEIGPKDVKKNQVVLMRRDSHERSFVSLDELELGAGEMLDTIHDVALEKVGKHRDVHTYIATGRDEFVDTINSKPDFIETVQCGYLECEEKIKEVAGATPRCIPFEQENLSGKCVRCGEPAKKMVYQGKAY